MSAWVVKDKNKLLAIAMEALAGSSHISFEGDLSALKLSSIPGSSHAEGPVLKRHTIWPQQDFVVVPLETYLVPQIVTGYGGTLSSRILHVQIETDGRLALGIYDNPACLLFASPTLPDVLLMRLQTENTLGPRTQAVGR